MIFCEGVGDAGSTDAWLTLPQARAADQQDPARHLGESGHLRVTRLLAISVAQVDQMLGGRVETGMGGGWYAQEHTAYGIPFPSLAERFDRYAESSRDPTPLALPIR